MLFAPEILSSILSHQPKTDLKTARLVSKAFDATAAQFLFRDIYLIARYADMEKASLLASRFGSYVRTLILSSEKFDHENLWTKIHERTKPNEVLTGSYYEFYQKLEDERQELRSGGEFFGHICNTLAVLPHLQKIILTNGERTKNLCWCQQAYDDGHSRNYNPFLDKDYPELESLLPIPDHICLTTTNGLEYTDWNVWPQILCALYTTGNTKVKAIATESCGSGLTVNAFCMTPRQEYCTAKVLPNLTSLHLHLGYNFDENDEDEIYSDRVIARTLSAAINLESLVIEVIGRPIGWEGEEHTPTAFELILGGCDMPKLVTFGLDNSAFTEEAMTKFLQHSQRLKHLSFLDVELMSGSWEKMFDTIKGSLALETFHFEFLHGGIAELSEAGFDCEDYEPFPAIEKFLLGAGPNPFSVAALEYAATENQYLRKQRKRRYL